MSVYGLYFYIFFFFFFTATAPTELYTLSLHDPLPIYLAGADLSYADLQGAEMAGVNLEGARLGKTIWVDGQRCAEGSVGGCVPLN